MGSIWVGKESVRPWSCYIHARRIWDRASPLATKAGCGAHLRGANSRSARTQNAKTSALCFSGIPGTSRAGISSWIPHIERECWNQAPLGLRRSRRRDDCSSGGSARDPRGKVRDKLADRKSIRPTSTLTEIPDRLTDRQRAPTHTDGARPAPTRFAG